MATTDELYSKRYGISSMKFTSPSSEAVSVWEALVLAAFIRGVETLAIVANHPPGAIYRCKVFKRTRGGVVHT